MPDPHEEELKAIENEVWLASIAASNLYVRLHHLLLRIQNLRRMRLL